MTTDQKIEQLVRSVLAAVDTRLDALRNEMRGLADDTRRRDADLAQRLDEFERRLATAATTAAPTPNSTSAPTVASVPAPAPIAVLETVAIPASAPEPSDEIDIDRLTDLLSERLSQLTIAPSLH